MASSLAKKLAEDSMSARAAWMHYAGGLTQADVAKKLGLTNLKAHRLITRANREGLVKVYIDGDVAECVGYESQLSERYGLDYCEVVPDLDEGALPLNALGMAGAEFIRRALENSAIESIGVGHGRTLAACVNHLARTPAPDKIIVSLLGGFSKSFSANPHDVIHRLAERTGAGAYVMPVPFFVNTLKDKSVILEQAGIQDVLRQAKNTSLKIVGLGSVDSDASVVSNGMVELQEIQAVQKAGGCGEMLGHFFDDQGSLLKTELSDRTMGLASDDLAGDNIVAVAGGTSKVTAIQAILKSRLLNGLITDECTARVLVTAEEMSD